MKRTVALTFVVILGLIVGCSSNRGPKVAKTDASVLDAAPPAPANIPSAEPLLVSGPINDTPVFAAPAPVQQASLLTPAPAPLTPTGTSEKAAGKSYTVKKGDTLFGIAKTQLGSGRDWQKIAAANPGLTPAKLKAGQHIALP